MLTFSTTNSYNSLREFVISNKLMLPKPTETWRLVKNQPVGSIIGLPTIQGIAVATNGILVAIERTDREILFCHLEWFRCDKGEIEPGLAKKSKPVREANNFVKSLMNFASFAK